MSPQVVKVVIYETDLSVLRYLTRLVKDCGYSVQAGVSALAALKSELGRETPPDLLIISEARPSEALRAVQRIQPAASPIVLCIDGELPATKSRLEEMGVVAIVRRNTEYIGCLIGAISRSSRKECL